jgi:hypothetical protein
MLQGTDPFGAARRLHGRDLDVPDHVRSDYVCKYSERRDAGSNVKRLHTLAFPLLILKSGMRSVGRNLPI